MTDETELPEIDMERAALLFGVVEQTTKHGAFNRIRDAAMKELQEMNGDSRPKRPRALTPAEGPANAARLMPSGEVLPNQPRPDLNAGNPQGVPEGYKPGMPGPDADFTRPVDAGQQPTIQRGPGSPTAIPENRVREGDPRGRPDPTPGQPQPQVPDPTTRRAEDPRPSPGTEGMRLLDETKAGDAPVERRV